MNESPTFFLTLLLALPIAAAVLALFLWPLRVIVNSPKVRFSERLGWSVLWLFALSLGLFFALAVQQAFLPQQLGPAPFLVFGPLPVWGLYFFFKRRTQLLPILPSPYPSLAFRLGKYIGIFLRLFK